MNPAKTNNSRSDQLTVEARSALAKLAAAENIAVEHSSTAETAMFNTDSRTLTLPMWDGMNKATYDMLVFHEVGHALHTPAGRDVVDNALDYLTDGDARFNEIAHSYLNVCEDPRIEKLIKRQFPGVRKDFTAAYKHIHNELDMFKIKGADVNAMRLIDKVNLHFKIGWMLPELSFTQAEMVLVNEVAKAETFTEMVKVAKSLFDLEKNKQDNKQKNNDGDGDGEAGDSDDSKESKDSNAKSDKSDDDSKESNSKGDAGDDAGDDSDSKASDSKGEAGDDESKSAADGESGDGDDAGDDKSDEAPSDDASKSMSGGSAESQNKNLRDSSETGEGGAASVMPADMRSETDSALSESLKSKVNKTGASVAYGELPEFDLDKVIRPWKKVRDSQEKFFANRPAPRKILKRWNEFNRDSKKVVQYLANQFKRKQAAKDYARSRTAKTGKIDPNRLAFHRTADDIFKNLTVHTKGKNHGLMMIVDWSGSMANVLQPTVEQLIQISMFARKVSIPFEVYSFSDVSPSNNRREEQVPERKSNTIGASTFGLHNYLSSEMRGPEFAAACFRIWRIAGILGGRENGSTPSEDRMTCTPLHEAMMATIQIAPLFRAKYKVEVLNTIFLTDGGSSYGLSTRDSYNAGSLVVRHKKTNAQVEDTGNGNAALMSILKNTAGVNTIGFHFPGSSYARFATPTDERNKSWKKNGFVESDESGFDSYFLIRPEKFKEAAISMKDSKNFTEYMKSQVLNKVLLGRFIEMIASNI